MNSFYKLKVSKIVKEANDTVSIIFELPESIKNEFNFEPGQYVTLNLNINNEIVRRSYSISSLPDENYIRIAVKKIPNGKASTFLNEKLAEGDEVEVMPPLGNFKINNFNADRSVFIAAGSGITPIISMIKFLMKNGNGKVELYYSNKTNNDVIYKEELLALKNNYSDRFTLNLIFTKEQTANNDFYGRIDKDKLAVYAQKYDLLTANEYYLCGPEQLINNVNEFLKEKGVDKNKIHFELFTVSKKEKVTKTDASFSGKAHVTVIMDGEEFDFDLDADGDSILDASIDAGVDAPFSCKGAVCCTCKAQVLEGKVDMEMNYALTDEEVEQGFILTCQAHPQSEKVVIDYDVV